MCWLYVSLVCPGGGESDSSSVKAAQLYQCTPLSDTKVRNYILNKYKSQIFAECKKRANAIFDTLVGNWNTQTGYTGTCSSSYGYRGNFVVALKNINVKVNGSGDILSKVNTTYYTNGNSDNYSTALGYVEFNCLNDVDEFAVSGISNVNSKLAEGLLTTNKRLTSLNDSETETIVNRLGNAYSTYTSVGNSTVNLPSGLYAVAVEGAGGGGGGTYPKGSGDWCYPGTASKGGWGQFFVGKFVVLKPTSITVTVGRNGHGGHPGPDSGKSDGTTGINGHESKVVVPSILTVTARGGNGGNNPSTSTGAGKTASQPVKLPNVTKGENDGCSRDGSRSGTSTPRKPGCGESPNDTNTGYCTSSHRWGYGGGPGRVRIYKLDNS